MFLLICVARTDYIIEQHNDDYIRINFDITMNKLSCDLASLDVVNQMGTHKVRIELIYDVDQCYTKY